MKKQFTKIKIAAENLSRSNKSDRKDVELELIEKQVDKYRDVLEKMVRKLPSASTANDTQERDKRIKKNSHYKIGTALEESSKELSKEMPLHHVLLNCGELEKSLAECMIDSELETENEVVRRLKQILDNEIQEISTLKRNVSRTMQEYTSLKRSYEAAIRLDEPQSKINHIKDQQEQCEVKLEKERDSWAAQMFELIAKEDIIVDCIRDYVLNQRNYHERALLRINSSLANIQDVIQSTEKSRFGTSLTEHLTSANRNISYILELCICCLLENGLYEEGILRVGCASTKLRRMKHALEAQYVKTPLPLDYQDPHVIGSILKLYLRELPEPLLTFKYYKDFLSAADRPTEAERKAEVKAILSKLPAANYANLRYLTKFLWLVTQNVEQNKMSSQNLAIVMSPNMLWPRLDKNNPTDYLGQVNSSSAVNVIVELMISQWDYFFEGEVEFFVTLQRNKLFVEGKSKSSSSNENLDKNDGELTESPRYGTIKRQKACAPSPPSKSAEKVQNHTSTKGTLQITHPTDMVDAAQTQKNGEVNHRGKELFPATNNHNHNNNNNTHNANQYNNGVANEKPEKPPLPKVLQLQHIQTQQDPQHYQQQQHQQYHQQQQQQTPKPVPMTRTQFFGLDKLPSPGAERRSADSVSSLIFKPDLPQKPKIPKRPMVLGVSSNYKSDEEITPTQQHSISDSLSTRHVTEKFIDKMRNENCDNNEGEKLDSTEHLHNPQSLINSNANSNANANALQQQQKAPTTLSSTANANSNVPSHSQTESQSQSRSQTHARTQSCSSVEIRTTPTTPISPNMLLTPKRPTVPAPPPPSVVKKQSE